MAQLSVSSVRSLAASNRETPGVGRLAPVVQRTNSKDGGSAEAGSADAYGDSQDVAVNADFVAEAHARSMIALNAVKGVSLLQVANKALFTIGIKLEKFAGLAEGAEAHLRTDFERVHFDAQFQATKGEIDIIAASTTFDGTPLLLGGIGPSGEFQASFQVGTGEHEHDEITILIAPASVSDLSAALAVDTLATQSGAMTARTNIAAAQDVLNAIRIGIAADIERFSVAVRNDVSIGQRPEIMRVALFDPTIPTDLSRSVAAQATAKTGVLLTNRGLDDSRQLLIKLSAPASGKRAA